MNQKTKDSYVVPSTEQITVIVESVITESNLEPIDGGNGFINW